jgi:hypothetical protein
MHFASCDSINSHLHYGFAAPIPAEAEHLLRSVIPGDQIAQDSKCWLKT